MTCVYSKMLCIRNSDDSGNGLSPTLGKTKPLRVNQTAGLEITWRVLLAGLGPRLGELRLQGRWFCVGLPGAARASSLQAAQSGRQTSHVVVTAPDDPTICVAFCNRNWEVTDSRPPNSTGQIRGMGTQLSMGGVTEFVSMLKSHQGLFLESTGPSGLDSSESAFSCPPSRSGMRAGSRSGPGSDGKGRITSASVKNEGSWSLLWWPGRLCEF